MKLAEFEKVANILAREHKITIHEGESWAANIKKREVYYRKEDIYTLNEDHILGLIIHEIAHIRYTTDVKYPDKNNELIHSAMNMLEDISIEHIISQDYPNAADILFSTKQEAMDSLVRLLPKLDHISQYEKALLYAAIRFENRGYNLNLEVYEKLGDEIAKIMKIKSDQIYNRKETKDLLPLANEIVDFIIQHLGEPDQETKNQIKSSASQEGKAEKYDQKNVQNKVIKQMGGGKGWGNGATLKDDLKYVDELIDQAQMIGRRIRSILKRNNAMEFGGRYRTGKLLPKRLVRIRAQKDTRPFARRIVKSNQSYAFAVASDISGSMFNYSSSTNSASYAMSSMQMVAEALRLAGIPRSLIVFGRKANTAVPMTRKQVNWHDIANATTIKKAGQDDTKIDEAIKSCMDQLKTIRAERKIMIILTDGSSDLQDMKEAHKLATSQGIECLAITIGDEWLGKNLSKTFGQEKNIIVRNDDRSKPGKSQIGEAFITILKNSITKSQ